MNTTPQDTPAIRGYMPHAAGGTAVSSAASHTLHLRPVNAGVFGVHGPDGQHLGNLKRVGAVWKFKAVGHDAAGQVEPGGGPLTNGHNAVFAEPDVAALNAALAPLLV